MFFLQDNVKSKSFYPKCGYGYANAKSGWMQEDLCHTASATGELALMNKQLKRLHIDVKHDELTFSIN